MGVEEIHDFGLVLLLEEGFALVFGGGGQAEGGEVLEYAEEICFVAGFFCVLNELLHHCIIIIFF